jgi:hypothetical protein
MSTKSAWMVPAVLVDGTQHSGKGRLGLDCCAAQ